MAKGKYKEWLEEDSLILLEGWATRGLSDEQIAHNMGISTSTLYEWKNKYKEISEALKRGKEVVDLIVENALYKRAIGCTITETRKEIDEKGRKKIVTYTKEIPPDTTAQIFWLKNRRPDLWRDKPLEVITDDVEPDGLIEALNDVGNIFDIPDDSDTLTDEE